MKRLHCLEPFPESGCPGLQLLPEFLVRISNRKVHMDELFRRHLFQYFQRLLYICRFGQYGHGLPVFIQQVQHLVRQMVLPFHRLERVLDRTEMDDAVIFYKIEYQKKW